MCPVRELAIRELAYPRVVQLPHTERKLLRMQCARKLPEFAEITPLCRLRIFKVTDFDTNRKLIYDFLLVINTNLPPILHRFGDIAVDRSETAVLGSICILGMSAHLTFIYPLK